MTGILRTKLRREIGVHKGQFVAVAVIIMLGVAVYGAYSDAYLNLEKSYYRTFDQVAHIAERSVEVATVRAEGVRLRGLSRLITVENLLVTLLGIPPGIALGLLLCKPLLRAYINDLWRFDLVLELATPFLVAAAICLTAVLSQWPGLRAIRRLDIATVVRLRPT